MILVFREITHPTLFSEGAERDKQNIDKRAEADRSTWRNISPLALLRGNPWALGTSHTLFHRPHPNIWKRNHVVHPRLATDAAVQKARVVHIPRQQCRWHRTLQYRSKPSGSFGRAERLRESTET